MNLIKNKHIDVFHAKWVDGATFCGDDEIPLVGTSEEIPEGMIPFSEAMNKRKRILNSHKLYVHFFEHDCKFWSFLRNPKKYFERLRKFAGIISPDISLYIDMPLIMQGFHVYLSRAITFFLQKNGFNVIPLVRWGDERSYRFAFLGIPRESTVCVSNYGCVKDEKIREIFYKGFLKMIEELTPTCILFFGSLALEMKAFCESKNIKIIEYKPNSRGHKISTQKVFDKISDLPLFK